MIVTTISKLNSFTKAGITSSMIRFTKIIVINNNTASVLIPHILNCPPKSRRKGKQEILN